MKEEKPKYGWYVKNLIIGFNAIGLLGLNMFIFGFYLDELLQLILLISGIVIIFVFLWPGIGMITMHISLLGRDSIVAKMNALKEIENPEILDVGCGTGRTAIKIAKELKNGGHLYGIDIYSKLAIPSNSLDTVQNNARIERVEGKTTFQYGTATEIPFEDNKFDIVNVSSVLHEVHSLNGQNKAVQELYRVLKPDGYLYIGEWNRTSRELIAFCGLFCFVFKHKNYWKKLLEQNRFKEISYENNAGFGLFTARK